MISKVEMLNSLTILSLKKVLFVRRSGSVIRAWSAEIRNPSETGFEVWFNFLVSERVSLDVEGVRFDIKALYFVCRTTSGRLCLNLPR